MIYLRDYISQNRIIFIDSQDKDGALNALVDSMSSSPEILDREIFRKEIFKREKIVSTGIGLHVAIPHVKSDVVKDLIIGIGICKKGIDWDAIDEQPVHYIFMIAGSTEQHDIYLRILSKIVLLVKNSKRRDNLLNSQSAGDIIAQFTEL